MGERNDRDHIFFFFATSSDLSCAKLSALFISVLTLWVKDSGVRWGAAD